MPLGTLGDISVALPDISSSILNDHCSLRRSGTEISDYKMADCIISKAPPVNNQPRVNISSRFRIGIISSDTHPTRCRLIHHYSCVFSDNKRPVPYF